MTPDLAFQLGVARDAVIAHVRRLTVDRRPPFLVAIDGGSGSGKSTLGSLVAEALGAALIRSDDFYASEIPDVEWDRLSPEARVAQVIDWRRLRREVLEPLRAGRPAEWHPFDFARVRADGTYPLKRDATRCEPAAVIVLEGAYSSRPELADLVNFSVLVDSPVDVRHRRLAAREDGRFLRCWHARWDEAEAYYFSRVRPKASFDLIVAN